MYLRWNVFRSKSPNIPCSLGVNTGESRRTHVTDIVSVNMNNDSISALKKIIAKCIINADACHILVLNF